MSSGPDLRLAFVGHEAAKFACSAFHYARSLPASKLVKVGVWERGAFVGAVIFSRGNTPNIGRPFALRQSEVCELTRIALAPHRTPTSRIVAIALRLLRRQSPGLRLVVSYADPAHGHDGRGVYAALGWLYLGLGHRESLLRVHGRVQHPRTIGSRFGHRGIGWLRRHVDATAERIMTEPKHRYVLPLDAQMHARLLPLAKPYPKRGREAAGGRPAPAGRAGSIPSRPLQVEVARV